MEANLAQPCAVNFWTFAGPVFAGKLAVLATGNLVRHFYANDPQTTQQTATKFAEFGAFWLVAGLTWIAMNKRNGAST